MSKIIDFHAHAFPDHVAVKAIPALEKKGNVQAFHDGRVSSLVESMDRAGIEKSVICSIATKPSQFEAIIEWSKAIRSERVIPFPSVHPADQQALEKISKIKEEGFLGVKMHPYYQEFSVDEERLLPLYEKMAEVNLILVMHTGFDIGFPRDRIADPARIVRVVEMFPSLQFVTTHLGAWDQGDEVREYIIGKPIFMECSYSLNFMSSGQARDLLCNHPQDYIFFGTDSPWADQTSCIDQVKSLGLEKELERKIFFENANKILFQT